MINAVDYTGSLKVVAGLDFNTLHGKPGVCKWKQKEAKLDVNGDRIYLNAQTLHTKQEVTGQCFMTVAGFAQKHALEENRLAAISYETILQPGEECRLEKLVYHTTRLLGKRELAAMHELQQSGTDYSSLLTDNEKWWSDIWAKSDIEIRGDEKNQQGIRFCIFQMVQTYHGAIKGTNIGAKGLTGEAYNGNAFWDTETYCLPFFLFHDPTAAKNLLYFRYATLKEAKKRAKELDCKGAFYPVATISGKECCNLWQHASLQLQASTAVAYGIWCYEHCLQEEQFLVEQGLEMLIEICRMLASRGAFNSDGSTYGYYGVMGPDEFQMMVNHNCYTNYMAKFTFSYTLSTMEQMRSHNSQAYKEILHKTGCSEKEQKDWAQKADKMLILYEKDRQLFEQHKGFFDLPHIDVDAIPVSEFPLYSHWTYDRIYRNDMIKQPDVLMFLFLFNSRFSEEVLRSNYEYYEPRCIHESSLSPSVHSILASQLQKHEEAYDFFQFATRMDLDNYNRNTEEGLHTTSIAAAWMNIVYGFGGMRTDGELLTFRPSIPAQWEAYAYRIVVMGQILCVKVEREQVSFQCIGDPDRTLHIQVYDTQYEVGAEKIVLAVPAKWRG